MTPRKMQIGIIGAGPCGLSCAKNALEFDCEVTVYERNNRIGGQWNYTDKVGNDEFGLPINSGMYKSVL